jgi:hypothetical protein
MRAFVTAVVLLCAIASIPAFARGSVHVRGYYRSNGTYVAPYVRTAPNNTKVDNWSTKGNFNPYTGKEGTKSPYESLYTPSYVRPTSDPIYTPGYVPPDAKPQQDGGH